MKPDKIGKLLLDGLLVAQDYRLVAQDNVHLSL